MLNDGGVFANGTLLWGTIKAFLIALVLTPIIRDVFRAYNVVDRPGLRKVHAYPIPRLGGIPIMVALVVGMAGLRVQGLRWHILPGAAAIFAVGLLDDVFDLPAAFKLLGQIAAAGIAFWTGLRMPGPFAISLLGTLFWLVLASNAFNLVDGLDGLCAGLGCTAACVFFAMARLHGIPALACTSLVLIGALVGFLCFNIRRATVFLGDSGALLIGFLLGCCGLLWSRETGPQISMFAPVLVIWVPVMDLGLAVVRRSIARRPIFSADQGHIHHRLLKRGLTPGQAVGILYAFGICAGTLAFLLGAQQLRPWQAPVIAGFLLLTVVCVRELRYSELGWRQT